MNISKTVLPFSNSESVIDFCYYDAYCMYVYLGLRARQHLRSLAPVMKIMMMDDYGGQMIFGDLVGLKLPDIRLTGEEKPRKKSHPGNLSRQGIEPGPAA